MNPTMLKLLNVSHINRTYGYVGLKKRVNDFLNPKVGFNTFQEIADDLMLFEKDTWQVTFTKRDFNQQFDHVYKVVGNGFLEEVE